MKTFTLSALAFLLADAPPPPRAVTRTVTVLDASGRPVEGIPVTVEKEPLHDFDEPPCLEMELVDSKVTNAKGRATFPLRSETSYFFTAKDGKGFGRFAMREPRPANSDWNADVTLHLVEARSALLVAVVASDGKPVRAQVLVEEASVECDCCAVEARPLENGTYRHPLFDAKTTRVARVRAHAPGFLTASKDSVAVTPGAETRIELRLTPAPKPVPPPVPAAPGPPREN